MSLMEVIDEESREVVVLTNKAFPKPASPPGSYTAGSVSLLTPETIVNDSLVWKTLRLMNTTGVVAYFRFANGGPTIYPGGFDLLLQPGESYLIEKSVWNGVVRGYAPGATADLAYSVGT